MWSPTSNSGPRHHSINDLQPSNRSLRSKTFQFQHGGSLSQLFLSCFLYQKNRALPPARARDAGFLFLRLRYDVPPVCGGTGGLYSGAAGLDGLLDGLICVFFGFFFSRPRLSRLPIICSFLLWPRFFIRRLAILCAEQLQRDSSRPLGGVGSRGGRSSGRARLRRPLFESRCAAAPGEVFEASRERAHRSIEDADVIEREDLAGFSAPLDSFLRRAAHDIVRKLETEKTGSARYQSDG